MDFGHGRRLLIRPGVVVLPSVMIANDLASPSSAVVNLQVCTASSRSLLGVRSRPHRCRESSQASPRHPTPTLHCPYTSSKLHSTHPSLGDAVPIRSPLHQLVQAQVFPRRLSLRLRGTLDAECGMLVWNHVVLVFRIDGLVVRGYVYLLQWERSTCEILLEGSARPQQRCHRTAIVVESRMEKAEEVPVLTSKRSATRGWFKWM